jgi:hypothetical protein
MDPFYSPNTIETYQRSGKGMAQVPENRSDVD